MSYSNSLKGCVLALPELYKAWNQTTLTIIKVPRGKYYSVLSDGELEMRTPEEMGEGAGICFRGTINELRSIISVNLPQGDLFANYPETTTPPDASQQLQTQTFPAAQDSHPENHPNGQQPRDNTPEDHYSNLAGDGNTTTGHPPIE